MHLQPRDEAILRLCYEQQFLVHEHIQNFFPAKGDREARRRVKELEKNGFICQEYHPIFGKRSLIRLDRMGTEWMSKNHPLAPPKRLNPATLIHDSLVTSVRLRLSRFWNAEFVPERAIKVKDYPEIPDGIFFFPSGNGIAIEIENSDKGRTRFIKLLQRWKDTSKIIFVLYIASNPKLFETLKVYLKAAPQDQPMGIVLWDHLKAGAPSVITSQGNVDLFTRREY